MPELSVQFFDLPLTKKGRQLVVPSKVAWEQGAGGQGCHQRQVGGQQGCSVCLIKRGKFLQKEHNEIP